MRRPPVVLLRLHMTVPDSWHQGPRMLASTTHTLFAEYPEIETWGVSFNTNIAGIQFKVISVIVQTCRFKLIRTFWPLFIL